MIKIGGILPIETVEYSSTALRKGISNKMPNSMYNDAGLVAINIYDKIIKTGLFDLHINSFYRSIELNRIIGGNPFSQHCKGQAIDLSCKNNLMLFNWIKENIIFDQLIWEYGTDAMPAWVHVSYKQNENRNQILRILNVKGTKKTIIL